MIAPRTTPSGDLARRRRFVSPPALWPAYPLLPVVRRRRWRAERGVVADLPGRYGLTGFSAAVFLTNVFCLPRTPDQLLALPREVYDSGDELIEGGWRVD